MSDKIPSELRYTKDHEWVRLDGDAAVVGITHHAQEALGAITFVDLPPEGKAVSAGDELAAIESAKAASDIFAPVSGEVAEVNEALEDEPGKVHADCYGEGWICKLTGVNAADADGLLTAEDYAAVLEQESE